MPIHIHIQNMKKAWKTNPITKHCTQMSADTLVSLAFLDGNGNDVVVPPLVVVVVFVIDVAIAVLLLFGHNYSG